MANTKAHARDAQGFRWTEKASAAAIALAEGKTKRDAADESGIDESTLYRWLRNPEFSAEVDRLSLLVGIATRAARVRLAQQVIRQKTSESGVIDTKADVLDWLKFIQSDTDGARSDIADKLAALFAAHPAAGAPVPSDAGDDDADAA